MNANYLLKRWAMFLLLTVGSALSAQTNFYVSSTTGSDSNTGKSWSQAYATLAKVMSQLDASAGTPSLAAGIYNIYIATGTYTFSKEYQITTSYRINFRGGYPAPNDFTTNTANNTSVCGSNTPTWPTDIKTPPSGSAIRLRGNSSLGSGDGVGFYTLTFQNLYGNAADGALVTIDGSNTYKATNKTVELGYIHILNYFAAVPGVIYDYNSDGTTVNIDRVVVDKGGDITSGGAEAQGGGFVGTAISGSSKNIKVNVSNSSFTNIKLSGTTGVTSMFYLVGAGTSGDTSAVSIKNSSFCSNNHTIADANAPGVLYASFMKTVTLENNFFTSNEGGYSAVLRASNSGQITSVNNIYQNNKSYNSGAVRIDGNSSVSGWTYSANFINDQFFGNSTTSGVAGYGGGAIYVSQNTPVSVSYDSTKLNGAGIAQKPAFVDNKSAADGGAIRITDSGNTVSVIGASFCNNSAAARGGAVFLTGATYNSTGNYYNKNYAAASGGAISIDHTASIIVSTFNSSGDYYNQNFTTANNGNGGAIFAYNAGSGNLNMTVSGNTYFYRNGIDNSGTATTNNGGAIFFLGDGRGTTSIANAYFVENAVKNQGGAIYISGPTLFNPGILNTLSSSTFYDNAAAGSKTTVRVSDIYSDYIAGYYGKIASFTNNSLQFAYDTGNYPTAGYGFTTVSGNTGRTASAPVLPAAMAAFSCVAAPVPVCGSVLSILGPSGNINVSATEKGTYNSATSVDACSLPWVQLSSPSGTPVINFKYHIRTLSGTIVKVSSTVSTPNNSSSQVGFSISGLTAPGDYYLVLESVTDANGQSVSYGNCYVGQNSAKITITACAPCTKPATIQATGALPTTHGITALGRAGANNGNWPMVRTGAWTALEAKTKGFVINRMYSVPTGNTNAGAPTATNGGTTASVAAPLKGMMFYDITKDCLSINTDGTNAGWKCFNTQTCPSY